MSRQSLAVLFGPPQRPKLDPINPYLVDGIGCNCEVKTSGERPCPYYQILLGAHQLIPLFCIRDELAKDG